MGKIGITGGTAIALSVLVTVLYYQPSHASDALLAKAQAEFTAKARDAVLQRRARAQTGMTLAALPQSGPTQTNNLPSPQQGALSSPASSEGSERSIPARPPAAPVPTMTAPVQTAKTPAEVATAPVQAAVTADAVQVPVEAAKLPEVESRVRSETKGDEAKLELKSLPAETPVERIVPPAQPELPNVAATPATAPVTPATVKVQKAANEPARIVPPKKATKTVRRLEREFSGERLPYNVEALRAKAPEIAAVIARYM